MVPEETESQEERESSAQPEQSVKRERLPPRKYARIRQQQQYPAPPISSSGVCPMNRLHHKIQARSLPQNPAPQSPCRRQDKPLPTSCADLLAPTCSTRFTALCRNSARPSGPSFYAAIILERNALSEGLEGNMLTFTTFQMATWKSAPRASCFPIASPKHSKTPTLRQKWIGTTQRRIPKAGPTDLRPVCVPKISVRSVKEVGGTTPKRKNRTRASRGSTESVWE